MVYEKDLGFQATQFAILDAESDMSGRCGDFFFFFFSFFFSFCVRWLGDLTFVSRPPR
jgi:hypothetical protein